MVGPTRPYKQWEGLGENGMGGGVLDVRPGSRKKNRKKKRAEKRGGGNNWNVSNSMAKLSRVENEGVGGTAMKPGTF